VVLPPSSSALLYLPLPFFPPLLFPLLHFPESIASRTALNSVPGFH
jgi:hypothetical protein